MNHEENPALANLTREIERLGEAAGGVIGVAAWRLDGTGPRLLVNAEQRFPMASTYKVPIACRILEQIEHRELALDHMLDVPPEMIVPSEVIADRFIHPGISLSVHNHLEVMLTQSDNSSTDVLMAAAGGPSAVTTWIRNQGILNLRIDRNTGVLLRDFFDVPNRMSWEEFKARESSDPELIEVARLPNPDFDDDPRDTSTPEAMATLLTRIFSGQALSAESLVILEAIMGRCRTGVNRLKAMLPKGTPFAHKTGTIGGTINDVGVITLPGSAGRVVIAAFIKKGVADVSDRERALAEIGRAVHDFYLFDS